MRQAIFSLLLAGSVGAREVPITILHTCDLHGNLLPTESYEGKTNLGGLARCATAIQAVRAKEKNVLLVDAGDTLQGAAVSYLSDGLVMVKALNALRYDAWCWGNHEFDWGLPKLITCAEAARVPILNANVHLSGGTDSANGHDGAWPSSSNAPATRIVACLKPFRIVELDGVKVGIIGLNTPGIPNWSRPRLIAGLEFADSVATLRSVIPAVKQAGAQVVVLVCHQGYREGGDDHANQINAIARNFPELDVIIGGHTHRNFPEFKVSNVLYCQADYYGIHLGRVDLVYDTVAGKVVRRESNTLLMDEKIPLEAELLKECGAELDRAEKSLATVIGQADGVFEGRSGSRRVTSIHTLLFESIADALRERGVAVDVIVHGILNQRGTLRKGPVTVGAVWGLVPYENTQGLYTTPKSRLVEILEENAAAYGKREFRGVWGLKWKFNPNLPVGHRTISLTRADGKPIADDELLTVAFNSYELASGGLRWKKVREYADRPESGLVEFDFTTRQAVIDYIRQRGTITPEVGNWWEVVGKSKPE